MNLDRWHLANQIARHGQPAKTYNAGAIQCLGRCGKLVSGNRKPPLCAACKILFDAQVVEDTARAAAAQHAREEPTGTGLGVEGTPAGRGKVSDAGKAA